MVPCGFWPLELWNKKKKKKNKTEADRYWIFMPDADTKSGE